MSRKLRSRVVLFTLLAVGSCGLDLWSKHVMFASPELRDRQVQWLLPGHAGFQLSLNEGGLFGMGQGSQAWLAVFSVAAAIAIPVWLFYFDAAADRLLILALGGVMGGVLGNLYDRVGLHQLMWDGFRPDRAGEPVYAVRDFILLAWDFEAGVVWPNFNLADSYLVAGAGVLFFRALRTPANGRATAKG